MLDVLRGGAMHASRDFRTPPGKAHAYVWQTVREGLQRVFGYVDLLPRDPPKGKQIPRGMVARDGKFVQRRVSDHDADRAKAFLTREEERWKSLQVAPEPFIH